MLHMASNGLRFYAVAIFVFCILSGRQYSSENICGCPTFVNSYSSVKIRCVVRQPKFSPESTCGVNRKDTIFPNVKQREKNYIHSYFSSYLFVGIQGEVSTKSLYLSATSLTFGLVSEIQIACPISSPSWSTKAKKREQEYSESGKGGKKTVLDTAITRGESYTPLLRLKIYLALILMEHGEVERFFSSFTSHFKCEVVLLGVSPNIQIMQTSEGSSGKGFAEDS
ncbi:hypothetical protein CEXT_195921 [Caerostris extrusa]|uniref:Uncharacterized protein n=1 Tax=Caerostris extrusa TaxID=172846 RepID=A0AAV4TA64_CAEEX|nr:hypothetical protein CEXT_195921 [Caerostris extrusa]